MKKIIKCKVIYKENIKKFKAEKLQKFCLKLATRQKYKINLKRGKVTS